MKNHIVIKFIAVILCAASLMGAVGGVLGVVLLSSGDLYNRSVEQMVTQRIHESSESFAVWLAKSYAGTELGSCSETMIQQLYGPHYFDSMYDPAYYGYTILDAEGNELMSYNPELREREDLYAKEAFPVSGKYMYLVSEESEEQTQIRERERRLEAFGADVVLDETGNTVPAEGAIVEEVIFADASGMPVFEAYDDGCNCVVTRYSENSSDTWVLNSEALGFLFYSPEGYVTFHSYFNYLENESWFPETEVYEAYFTFREGQLRLADAEAVGRIFLNDSGYLMFFSTAMTPLEAAAEETVPETIPETNPETTAAVVPETQAAEAAQAPAETEAVEQTVYPEETEQSSASDIPEETEAPAETEAGEPSTEPVAAETIPAETVIAVETIPAETVPAQTVPVETVPEPVVINGKALGEYQINSDSYYDNENQQHVSVKYVYVPLPEMTVEVYMTENAVRYRNGYEALEYLRSIRNYLLPIVGACLLLFAVFGVYLCTAAGRKPKSEEVRAGGLNRLPLDLYLLGGGFGAACIIAIGGQLAEQIWEQDIWVGCGMLVAVGFLSSLLLVGFCFAFVAQIKTPDGFWWRNTLCGHGIRLFMRFAMWLEDFLSHKGLPFLGHLLKVLWQYTMQGMVWLYRVTEKSLLWLNRKLRHLGRWLWKTLHRGLILLPITWQWLAAGLVMILFVMLSSQSRNSFLTLICLLIPIAITLYGAYCFGMLAESTRRMGKGDLDTKVDEKLMVGCFKESAADLNALADVAVVAAQKQLKSERMKTELITNVSHDIKTPLTSIINYVDLLRKPHTEEEGEQYLEVLDRQSQRLKKLIDDLMDMSKANTGNMAVEITVVDAVESVNQALGEFSDKLDRARLTPVFRHTEDHLTMRADGRLVWRVLSNLLGNAVKYAMPGTRLYIDLMELEGKVIISLKNISREELNVNAEELMERFVRGDDSRNTEGSGLGLNIAKSLMELQKGQLQLLVDGDLFKVTLIFPGIDQ